MLTVLAGAVSGGLRYFDRVSDVSGVDTCHLLSVDICLTLTHRHEVT